MSSERRGSGEKSTRKVNRWNAFLHDAVKKRAAELGPDAPRVKIHEIASGVRAQWDAMSEAERIAATQDSVTELDDMRESRKVAKQKSAVGTTRDVRTTLDSIENQLQELHTRTGTEVLLIAVRSDVEHYSHKPRVFASHQRVTDFFEHTTNRTVNEFSVKLQAYCVAGVETPPSAPQRTSPQQQLMDLKRRVKDLINDKLQECAEPDKISRMNYMDFEYHITEKHGIVLENWPLPTFCAPGSISSLKDLEILYDAWNTGTTTFRKLSPEEHQAFKEARMQQRVHAAAQAAIQGHIQACPPPSAHSASSHHSETSEQPEAGPSSVSMSPSLMSVYSTPHDMMSPTSPTMDPPEQSISSPAPLPIAYDSQPLAGPSSVTTDPNNSTASPPDSISAAQLTQPQPPPGPAPRFIFQHPPGMPVMPYYSMADAGPSQYTFKLSTGKRPVPSSFNVMGPYELAPKKPRKKRADAGMKRGPNKRTLAKAAGDDAQPSQHDQPPAALIYPSSDPHPPTTDVQPSQPLQPSQSPDSQPLPQPLPQPQTQPQAQSHLPPQPDSVEPS